MNSDKLKKEEKKKINLFLLTTNLHLFQALLLTSGGVGKDDVFLLRENLKTSYYLKFFTPDASVHFFSPGRSRFSDNLLFNLKFQSLDKILNNFCIKYLYTGNVGNNFVSYVWNKYKPEKLFIIDDGLSCYGMNKRKNIPFFVNIVERLKVLTGKIYFHCFNYEMLGIGDLMYFLTNDKREFVSLLPELIDDIGYKVITLIDLADKIYLIKMLASEETDESKTYYFLSFNQREDSFDPDFSKYIYIGHPAVKYKDSRIRKVSCSEIIALTKDFVSEKSSLCLIYLFGKRVLNLSNKMYISDREFYQDLSRRIKNDKLLKGINQGVFK